VLLGCGFAGAVARQAYQFPSVPTSDPDPWPTDRRPIADKSASAIRPVRLVRWRGTDAPQYVAQKAAEACDEQVWAFWLEVERAVKELLTETAPPDATQH